MLNLIKCGWHFEQQLKNILMFIWEQKQSITKHNKNISTQLGNPMSSMVDESDDRLPSPTSSIPQSDVKGRSLFLPPSLRTPFLRFPASILPSLFQSV